MADFLFLLTFLCYLSTNHDRTFQCLCHANGGNSCKQHHTGEGDRMIILLCCCPPHFQSQFIPLVHPFFKPLQTTIKLKWKQCTEPHLTLRMIVVQSSLSFLSMVAWCLGDVQGVSDRDASKVSCSQCNFSCLLLNFTGSAGHIVSISGG